MSEQLTEVERLVAFLEGRAFGEEAFGNHTNAKRFHAAASRLEELERENAELKARNSVPQEVVELVERLIQKWDLPASDGRMPAAKHAQAIEAWLDFRLIAAALARASGEDGEEA